MNFEAGQIKLCEQSISEDMSVIQNMIGVCSQNDIYFPGMTAFQQIELIAKFCNIQLEHADMRDFALNLLSKVQLENNIDGKISQFSGGMQRRFCLALATIGKRPILFLDEPTTGLVFIKAS
jgi:ABC-type multidrug transport system ATPase subunit